MKKMNMAAHLHDDDYAGVCLRIGNSRVALSAKGTRYHLQYLVEKAPPDQHQKEWATAASFASRSALVKKVAPTSETLADFFASSLPEKPRSARPDFQKKMAARTAAFKATSWKHDEYPWVLQVLHHVETYTPTADAAPHEYDWLRLIVSPKRDNLAFQVNSLGVGWSTALMAETPSLMRDLFSADRVPVMWEAKCMFETECELHELWQAAVSDGTLEAMLKDVPEDLADLDLPPFPERPETRAEQRRAKNKRASSKDRRSLSKTRAKKPAASRRKAG